MSCEAWFYDAVRDLKDMKGQLEDLTLLTRDVNDYQFNAQRRDAKVQRYVKKHGSLEPFSVNEDQYYDRIRRNYKECLRVQTERLETAQRCLIDAATQRLKAMNANVTQQPHKESESETDLSSLCLCGLGSLPGPMVGCDNPSCTGKWFHYQCVGIIDAPLGDWYCPSCTLELFQM